MGSKILFNAVFINLEQVVHSRSFFAVQSVDTSSTSCVRTAYPKFSASLRQLVDSLTRMSDLLQGCPNNSDTVALSQDCPNKAVTIFFAMTQSCWNDLVAILIVLLSLLCVVNSLFQTFF